MRIYEKMVDLKSIMSVPISDIQEASKELNKDGISHLMELLSIKDDKISYQAFLLLQGRSAIFDDVYPFCEVFRDKLKSGNSYQ